MRAWAKRVLYRLGRWLRPPRTLRPTRAGWVFFVLTLAVGSAALNTGNNLLYLVLSLMLAFLVLSGVLSESALRGLTIVRCLPDEIFEGKATRIALEIRNSLRRVPSFAVAVEDRVREGKALRAAGRAFALRVGPGATETRLYHFEAQHRGPVRFVGFKVSTRFPFGLFMKSLILEVPGEALVYPALRSVSLPDEAATDSKEGDGAVSQPGAGSEVSGLRNFQTGDPARRIAWRASLRSGSLVVRESQGERRSELEVRLRTLGTEPGERFEEAVRRAASRIVEGLETGFCVGLRTDDASLPAGSGRRQRTRLLTFLARVEAAGAGKAS